MDKYLKKSIQDLEFVTVTRQVASRCNTELGKEKARTLEPMMEETAILTSLGETSEYRSSFTNENRIPNHGFEAIDKELLLLKVENTTLEIAGFRKIKHISLTVLEHKKFFKKFCEYYPLLHQYAQTVTATKAIPDLIDEVIDKFGLVKDSASVELRQIRQQMSTVKGKISQSFGAALNTYQASEFLDEIRESVVDNRRVLAVRSMYRKKVKGTVMGTSKTGSIIYIEPEAVAKYSREFSNLQFDEKEEVQKILNLLTDQIRPSREDLRAFQDYLIHIDVTGAKAKYASEMNAIKPSINHEKRLFLRDAFHPLLYLANKRDKLPTFPQTIDLYQENRIIVISGPNAGGKSITLKTIGLLQLMVQSGLLIPVHERSSVCLFQTILTDIGDNQSIENHLSTYSYRLKNMNQFLRKCDDNTLFLIDEFGTGSDPELGGALAEAFLEVFYERGAFGVITTHYANLKALANELPHAANANMLFDSSTLQPTFHLELGQPGSSFTFEVAQKNGIPFSLINKAKKKVERGKIRFDATIAKLQKERSKMAKTGNRLQEEENKAREEALKLEKLNSKIKTKLESYQELYDFNQRMIHLGTKVNKVAEKYFLDKKKRPLVSELLRLVETENSKRKKKTAKEVKAQEEKKTAVTREVQKEVKTIRTKKAAAQKKAKVREKKRPRPVFKIGDKVRLLDGKAVGSIDSLEKNKAVVNYGIFTTNVSVEQLELAESKKK